jgi:septin family protein
MLCGEAGCGKHTFVNNLCGTTVFADDENPAPNLLRFDTRDIRTYLAASSLALDQPGQFCFQGVIFLRAARMLTHSHA